MKLRHLFIVFTFSGVLAACGGGGNSDCKASLGVVVGCDKDSAVVNTAPVAHAGGNQNVLTGAVVALSGTASLDAQKDPLMYSWSFDAVPEGSQAVLVSPATAQPNFVADVAGAYVLRLVVSDGKLSSPPALVVVTASVKNEGPVASAGANQSVIKGDVVTLDGTASSDPNRNTLDFTWALVTRPLGSSAVLSSLTAIKPTFVADTAGTYVAGLRVFDGRESSPVAYTTVVVSEMNAAPVAVTSVNQNVVTGATVTLDGTGSTDANRDPLTYNWVLTTKPNGSSAALSSATSPKPSFVVDAVGLYVASLKVSDGQVSSDNIAITTVTASVANSAPVAIISANQNVLTGALVTLDGSSSTDADRDLLYYNWVLTAKPAGSTASLSAINSPRPSFNADLPGTYVASLVVSDGSLSSAVAVGSVTASTVNSAPVAVAGPNQSVKLNTVVTLEGRLSYDPNRDNLTYSWVMLSKPAGSAATLLPVQGSATPTFTADLAGTYVASLVVSDGQLFSGVAATTVLASATNLPPVAHAGVAQTVKLGATVTLDGSGSTDADGNSLTYAWQLAYQPAGSSLSLSSLTDPGPSFVPAVAGVYVFNLVVNDGLANSAQATVTVTVVP